MRRSVMKRASEEWKNVDVGFRIKLGSGSPLVAFLRMYCMPHRNLSSTEYILGGDCNAHLLAFRRKSVPSLPGQMQEESFPRNVGEYQNTRRVTPENNSLHSLHLENVKSCTDVFILNPTTCN
jgi:hypothetical protein